MMIRIALVILLALFSLTGCAPQAAAPTEPPEAVSPTVTAEEAPAPEPSPTPDATPEPDAAAPLLTIPKGDTPREQFLAFLEQVNASRRDNYGTRLTFSTAGMMGDLSDLADDFTEEEMRALLTSHGGAVAVTAQQAREDIETAFKLLRHSYGAYDYFGGDEVFFPLRDAALECLPETGQVAPEELEAVLMEVLSPVLVDGHFEVGSSRPVTPHSRYMYYVPDLYFDDPAGVDPALVKPTIDSEGRLRLCLAVTASETEAEALPDSAVVEGETVSLNWVRDDSRMDTDLAFAEETLADGTPLLVSRRMWNRDDEELNQLEQLAACGSRYRFKPLLVFDVRSNGGGSDWYIMNFFHGYTDKYFNQKSVFAMKFSPFNLLALEVNGLEFNGVDTGWNITNRRGAWVKHNGVTLVLQDKGVGSSGETAVTAFRTLENTLFIGCNTLGCDLTPNCINLYLPNSGLNLYWGTGLCLLDDGENIDGTGFMPDLWVPSGQAQEAAERMIAYYDLGSVFTG